MLPFIVLCLQEGERGCSPPPRAHPPSFVTKAGTCFGVVWAQETPECLPLLAPSLWAWRQRRQAGAPGKLLFMQLGPLPLGGGRKRGQLGFLGK